jgi:CBS domain-containing protein
MFPIGLLPIRICLLKSLQVASITVAVIKNHVNSVVTVPENVSLAEAQLLMLKNNVAHLCVTADGTNKSIVKVISEHD